MSCEGQLCFLANDYALLSALGYATSAGQADSSNHCRWLNPISTIGAATHRLDYDLGVNFATIAPANCVAIFGFWEFVSYGGTVTVAIKAADDASYSSGLVTVSLGTVTLGDLTGIQAQDWYEEFTGFSVAKRYWRVEITTTNSINPPVRDVMLGNKILITRDPIAPLNITVEDNWSEARRNSLILELKYEGLTAVDKTTLYSRLFKYSDVITVAMIDRANKVLFGKKIMRASLDRHFFRLRENGQNYRAEIKIMEAL